MEFLSLVEKTQHQHEDSDESLDMADAWVAMGGKEDGAGTIEVEKIRQTFKAFELEIDVDFLLTEIKMSGPTIDFDTFSAMLDTSKAS
mmetsp:Transcript_61019/g.132520  ORF Transcript_61019/g.132520 Transcript_61019/m.132520 type:complete len:88 (-) Transcript_61019:37-300(-)